MENTLTLKDLFDKVDCLPDADRVERAFALANKEENSELDFQEYIELQFCRNLEGFRWMFGKSITT
jgi:hypothetical protein